MPSDFIPDAYSFAVTLAVFGAGLGSATWFHSRMGFRWRMVFISLGIWIILSVIELEALKFLHAELKRDWYLYLFSAVFGSIIGVLAGKSTRPRS